MVIYAKNALTGNSYSLLNVEETLRMPLVPELMQMITTFPLNVILAVTVFLVIGIIVAFTRKPTRSIKANVDVNGEPVQKFDRKMSQSEKEANTESRSVQEVEEEIPRRFEGDKDGVIKLYNWFYGFAQKRLKGVTGNMTPREFESAVLGMIPSKGALALEYLVTSFEIANYSDFKITKEIVEKSMRAIEVLKDLIENGSSYMHEHDQINVESISSVQA